MKATYDGRQPTRHVFEHPVLMLDNRLLHKHSRLSDPAMANEEKVVFLQISDFFIFITRSFPLF